MQGTAAPISLITHTNSILEDMSITGWLKKPYQVGAVLMSAIPFKTANDFPKSWPKVTSWLEALRKSPEGNLPVGAAGFCWGGKHTVNLCHGFKTGTGRNLIDAGFTAHPSSLDIPTEIEKVRLPLAIAHAEKDMALKAAQFETIKEVLEKLKKEESVESECIQYDGATHGFAVRADERKDEAKQAADAEEQAIKWFQTHFAKVKR
jgi:dienelactone hydrolase